MIETMPFLLFHYVLHLKVENKRWNTENAFAWVFNAHIA